MRKRGTAKAAKNGQENLLRHRKLQEQLELTHSNERDHLWRMECDARQWMDVTESQEWMQKLIDFYETILKPSSKLMVGRKQYDDIRRKLVLNDYIVKIRSHAANQRQREVEGYYEAMQQELAHVRSQVRDLSSWVDKHLAGPRNEVHSALSGFIESVKRSIVGEREDCEQSGRLLNKVLERSRIEHCEIVERIDAQAQAITQVLQEQSSMHTCIPRRIRSLMMDSEKSDFMLMFDTLSFEDVVMKYLRYRYSPGPDDPFGHVLPSPRRYGSRSWNSTPETDIGSSVSSTSSGSVSDIFSKIAVNDGTSKELSCHETAASHGDSDGGYSEQAAMINSERKFADEVGADGNLRVATTMLEQDEGAAVSA